MLRSFFLLWESCFTDRLLDFCFHPKLFPGWRNFGELLLAGRVCGLLWREETLPEIDPPTFWETALIPGDIVSPFASVAFVFPKKNTQDFICTKQKYTKTYLHCRYYKNPSNTSPTYCRSLPTHRPPPPNFELPKYRCLTLHVPSKLHVVVHQHWNRLKRLCLCNFVQNKLFLSLIVAVCNNHYANKIPAINRL